jgi:hypothetical membrane protein
MIDKLDDRTRPRRRSTDDPGERRPAGILALAVAGIVGPIVFTMAFVVQGLLRRGGYDAIAESVSALEGGPAGWVQQVNFALLGFLMIAFAIGLHLGMRRAPAGVIGPAILAWNGVGLLLAAVFPLREDARGLTYDPNGLHTADSIVFFLSIGIGLIVISRRVATDEKWRGLAGYTLTTGIALVVMFAVSGVLVQPVAAPLHRWAGLAQRAILGIWFPCLVILALRLLRVARAAGQPARHQPGTEQPMRDTGGRAHG